MATLFVFGCSLSHSSSWPQTLAKKFDLDLVNCAVPAGDNVTQCRRFIDLFLQDCIKNEDIIIWEITYLDRMGFRLRPNHPFYNNADKVKHNLHSFKPNLFDNNTHSDYVAFNHEWYDVWYYLKNTTQTLQELIFTLTTANKIVDNKCLVWFAQNNLFDDDQDKVFCKLLDKNNIQHLDYYTQSMISWIKQHNLPLAADKMHPTEAVYQKFIETFVEDYVKSFIIQK
jgi:hypothetical protein